MQPIHDFASITELPGTLLSPEQFHRFVHRYVLGADLARDRRVLEVACAAGIGLGYLGRTAQQVVGLDFTESLLRLARLHYGVRYPLLCGDGQRLPFADSAFDLVLCFEAIYYMTDCAAFCAESRRVLAGGGTLLICESNPQWPDFVPGDLSTQYLPAPDLADLLSSAGFRNVRLYGILPIADNTAQQSFANHLRHVVLRSGFLPRPGGPLATVLKRAIYGKLRALPSELDPLTLDEPARSAQLVPLEPGKADRVHRVLYAFGQV